jgi:hypothetical protein
LTKTNTCPTSLPRHWPQKLSSLPLPHTEMHNLQSLTQPTSQEARGTAGTLPSHRDMGGVLLTLLASCDLTPQQPQARGCLLRSLNHPFPFPHPGSPCHLHTLRPKCGLRRVPWPWANPAVLARIESLLLSHFRDYLRGQASCLGRSLALVLSCRTKGWVWLLRTGEPGAPCVPTVYLDGTSLPGGDT